ncbi:hypothetical protein [Candidatus Laterigemmans baculatus]|uniref:hypothetical protein n=1 Tax=Candidatus Laterigemmans baculatus TaxID=2770505 RepID=UPI0013DA4D67|nr:hypothetical protein [Candidatus Laterigemmans baculatus]
MQFLPIRPRVFDRGVLLAASVALLAQAGCAHLSIPSDRHGGLPTSPARHASARDMPAGHLPERPGATCDAEPATPWPRFHPLPTQPLVGPADPGWP